jgi:two-component system, LuxR family, sensor kinase FixL
MPPPHRFCMKKNGKSENVSHNPRNPSRNRVPKSPSIDKSAHKAEKPIREQSLRLAEANLALREEFMARQRAERHADLLLRLSQTIANAPDASTAICTAMEEICHAGGWEYGEAWTPRDDNSVLECNPACCYRKPEQDLAALREFTFTPGAGPVGRAWSTQQPEWIEDISKLPEDSYPRAQMVAKSGFKAALAVPVIAEARVLTVLIFFTSESREKNQWQVDLAVAIAAQIGAMLQRKEMEDDLRRAREELEARVWERTAELTRANAALHAEIAGREQIEKDLYESEERWRLMSDSLPVLIAYIDAEERYQLTNAAYEVRFGFTKEQVKGQKVRDVIGETAYARLKSDIDAALAGQTVTFTGELHYKTTGVRYVRIDYVPRRSEEGRVLGFYALNLDITEQKRAEAELRRSESWLQSLIQTTQDAVIAIDGEGRIVLFNPAAERMFGYTKEEIEGQKINLLMPEPHASEHDEYIRRYEAHGDPRAIGRIRMVEGRRKDGEIFPLELSLTEVETTGSEHGRYAAFIRDMSEKTKLQDQLVDSERLAAIGTTMSVFAHEIGNPLNAMFVAVQLVERELSKVPDGISPSLAANVKGLKDEITRLSHLLHDFRSLSQRKQYNFHPLSLGELVGQLYSLESEKLRAQGITAEQSVPADLPLIVADRDKLTQALLNLCENACEAMPRGGKLSCAAEESGDQVIFEIRDTGIGIPEKLNVFEPFITTKSSGTGLGLMIVRQIISAHAGTISYNSNVDEGTVFRISLPIYRPGKK